MLLASFGITWLTRIFQRSRFVSGMPSGTPLNRCANILLSAHAIVWVPLNFTIYAHGRVAGFEAIRIYYLPDSGAIHIIRVLHGKRDLKRILEPERTV